MHRRAARASVCSSSSLHGEPLRLFAVRTSCPAGSVEYGGVGVNAFDALWCGSSAMASPCTYADVQHMLRHLASSGLRYFRCFASLYGYRQVQWLRDPSGFWAAFDRLMHDVQQLGLSVVLSIGAEAWHLVANAWTNRSTSETLNDLVTSRTSTSRSLAVRYTTEVVRRYSSSKAVLFWELGNELNLNANMPRGCGDRERCFSTSDLVSYTTDLVDAIRRNDPQQRPISSGFGVARPTAWHQEHCRRATNAAEASDDGGSCSAGGAGSIDSLEQWQRMVQWQHEAVDIVSTHLYAGLRGCWFGRGANQACYRQTNISLLDAVAAAAAAVNKPLYLGEYGGPAPNFTGPTASARAYPEAVLDWLDARARVRALPHGKESWQDPAPQVLSSIWAWACPSKRASGMQCLGARRQDASPPFTNVGDVRLIERLRGVDDVSLKG